MKNALKLFGITMLVMAMFLSCSKTGAQQANPASDFQVKKINGDKAIEITKYVGNYVGTEQVANIPAKIQGLPVIRIGDNAFAGKNLTSVTIPNSVIEIGANAFNFNNLTSIVIPNSVTTIRMGAFSSNNLTSITIPNSITIIEIGVFGNNKLTTVTIPNGVTTIGGGAFMSNRLTSVTIPASVTSIGMGAFGGPDFAGDDGNKLTSITFEGETLFSTSDISQAFLSTEWRGNGPETVYSGKGTYVYNGSAWTKQ